MCGVLCTSAQSSYVAADGLSYTITNMVDNICHVTGIRSSRELLTIPNEVEIRGRIFTVSEIERAAFGVYSSNDWKNLQRTKYVIVGDNVYKIGENAFTIAGDGINNIRQVVLGKNVNNIDWGAFDSSNLKVIVSLNPTPPSVGNRCFNTFTFDSCTVYVPDASIQKYRKDGMWSRFWAIKGLSELSKDPNYKTAELIQEEEARRDSVAAIEREVAGYKQHLEPFIQGGVSSALGDFLFGSSVKKSKSKLVNATTESPNNYTLSFAKGEKLSNVNFSKVFYGAWKTEKDWTSLHINGYYPYIYNIYMCYYDLTQDVALCFVVPFRVKYSHDEYERYGHANMILINKGVVHKIDKNIYQQMYDTFFADFRNTWKTEIRIKL